jgi:hypothetical protein
MLSTLNLVEDKLSEIPFDLIASSPNLLLLKNDTILLKKNSLT